LGIENKSKEKMIEHKEIRRHQLQFASFRKTFAFLEGKNKFMFDDALINQDVQKAKYVT